MICHDYGLANPPVPQWYPVLLRDNVESSKAYQEAETGGIVSPLLDQGHSQSKETEEICDSDDS